MKSANNLKLQRGSALITVLVMLMLITIIGTLAVRGSMTSLNIATNAQAQALLMQNSDATFFKIENETNDDLKFTEMRIGDGMLAYVLRPENKGKELVFCIRGSVPDHFSGSRIASVVYWSGNTIQNKDLGSNGFCRVSRAGDFISERKAVMTQVSIRAAESDQDFEHMVEGEDKKSSKGQDIQTVVVNSTSILPNLSSSLIQEVDDCLSNYTSFVDEVIKNTTVMDCLADKSVPYSVQEMEYTLRSVSAS